MEPDIEGAAAVRRVVEDLLGIARLWQVALDNDELDHVYTALGVLDRLARRLDRRGESKPEA